MHLPLTGRIYVYKNILACPSTVVVRTPIYVCIKVYLQICEVFAFDWLKTLFEHFTQKNTPYLLGFFHLSFVPRFLFIKLKINKSIFTDAGRTESKLVDFICKYTVARFFTYIETSFWWWSVSTGICWMFTYSRQIPNNVRKGHRWFFLVCFFGVYRPTRKIFTHMETSPLPVEGCKFWPMLGTYGHWAMRFL